MQDIYLLHPAAEYFPPHLCLYIVSEADTSPLMFKPQGISAYVNTFEPLEGVSAYGSNHRGSKWTLTRTERYNVHIGDSEYETMSNVCF